MKALYDLIEQVVRPYPRADDGEVAGLDTERYLVVELVEENQPEYDPATQRLERTQTLDQQACTFTYGWNVIDDAGLILADKRRQMRALCEEMSDADRAQFGKLWSAVESALNRGDIAAAKLMIENTSVPSELAERKAAILALFPS